MDKPFPQWPNTYFLCPQNIVHKFYIFIAVDLINHVKAVKMPSNVAQARSYNILKMKSSYPNWFAEKLGRKLIFDDFICYYHTESGLAKFE